MKMKMQLLLNLMEMVTLLLTKQKQRTFHFVIKSPPKAAFIKMMHKMTKPFLNEVTWYLVSIFNVFCVLSKQI